ncbi:hypothetical protein BpHYR1_039344 [Brachionus plicatilis]|uniref:Uncharacterized protein n=1 Tax=Brachionus plicatilis TaxID=10195 RepID=A0A3M7SUT4_BRAPC|nr:hypothetical protein BpHYR1_039344 [Brachionus plicatilis]
MEKEMSNWSPLSARIEKDILFFDGNKYIGKKLQLFAHFAAMATICACNSLGRILRHSCHFGQTIFMQLEKKGSWVKQNRAGNKEKKKQTRKKTTLNTKLKAYY